MLPQYTIQRHTERRKYKTLIFGRLGKYNPARLPQRAQQGLLVLQRRNVLFELVNMSSV